MSQREIIEVNRLLGEYPGGPQPNLELQEPLLGENTPEQCPQAVQNSGIPTLGGHTAHRHARESASISAPPVLSVGTLSPSGLRLQLEQMPGWVWPEDGTVSLASFTDTQMI